MKKNNKFLRMAAIILSVVMVLFSFSGCDVLDEGMENGPDSGYYDNTDSYSDSNTSEKGLLDDLLDIFGDDSGYDSGYYDDDDDYDYSQGSSSSDSSDDLMSILFDSFFGGSSSDYGWGESSYSGGSDNYTGSGSSFEYADISDISSGSGKFTLLVYMIGSNLETDGGCGTMDIQEMIDAKVDDNVNIILEAGGAKKWQNSVMSNGKAGRYKITGKGIQVLDAGSKKSMVETSELKDFIKYGVSNFPADRYALIFWDHGGATLAGFGTDEMFSGELSIDEISQVLNNSGVHFDFVGYDACLMGNIETAYSLKDCADYLIASEEEEPGYGWHYTGFLKALSKNPSLDMTRLGTIIVDDFVASNGRDDVSLSVIDLKKIENVYTKMATLFANGSKEIYAGNYRTLSKARKNSKGYGGNSFDQIDIIDFCNKCGLDGADDVVSAVKSAVVYEKTNIDRTNGLAMYFPYDYPSYYNSVLKQLKSFGMNNKSYYGFFDNLLSSRSGGTGSRSMKPIEVQPGYIEEDTSVDLTTTDWYVPEVAEAETPVTFDLDEDGLLILRESGDNFVVKITDEQYDAMAFADIGVFLDDGEGYIDLGNDSLVEYDENGDLVLAYNSVWVAIDGNIVPFYIIDEGYDAYGKWYSYGEVDAEFTSARTGETRNIEIILCWDEDHDGGYVKGYRTASDSDAPSQAERSVTQFVKGDKIQFVCEYYTYDGEYDDCYYLHEPIIVNKALKVTYDDLDGYDVLVYGHIKDLYGNDYYTEFFFVEG